MRISEKHRCTSHIFMYLLPKDPQSFSVIFVLQQANANFTKKDPVIFLTDILTFILA